MATVYQRITDPRGNAIGYIDGTSDVQFAHDRQSRTLGVYMASSNATTDPAGRLVAVGNYLTALIFEAATR